MDGALAWPAKTKCHTVDGLNNRKLLSRNSGGLKSEIRVPMGLGS